MTDDWWQARLTPEQIAQAEEARRGRSDFDHRIDPFLEDAAEAVGSGIPTPVLGALVAGALRASGKTVAGQGAPQTDAEMHALIQRYGANLFYVAYECLTRGYALALADLAAHTPD